MANPEHPEHPGVALRRHIRFSNTHSAKSISKLCGIEDLNAVLNEGRNLTQAEATRVGYLLGDEEFWQNLRKKYDEYVKYISEE